MRGPAVGERRRWWWSLVLASGVLGAGCSAGVGTLTFPSPPAVTAAPTPAPADSLPAGLASTPEAPVSGATTTIAPRVGPGPDTLNGTVLGPSGPVGGAVVQADRLVGDAVASVRTTTAADGSWSFRNVLGGRWRVRAWRSPDLDLTAPQIIFVGTSDPPALTLQLSSYQAQQVSGAINPSDPVAGSPANLVVQVVQPTVSPDGLLTYPPVPGASVSLVSGPDWQVSNGNPLVTDGSGQVLFAVECTTPGAAPLSAQVGAGAPVALQMPPCGAPASAPTGSAPAFQLPGSGSTTTTCPGGTTPSGSTDPNATTTSLAYGNC